MNKFRNNEQMPKEATYLYEPNKDLPGVFIEIPVNRKARRIENRKLRQNKVKERFVPTAYPLVRVESGYYRTVKGDFIWRESQRDFVRAKAKWMRKNAGKPSRSVNLLEALQRYMKEKETK